jgi:hypothetical protein
MPSESPIVTTPSWEVIVMIRRGIRSIQPRFAILAAVIALTGVAFWPSLAEGASKFQNVIIRNTSSEPVPVVDVSPASPVLRSGQLELLGTSSQPIPAGVVLTDLVVSRMAAGCEVSLHQGEDESIRLAPVRDAAERVYAELHLETGLLSTADRPLTLRNGGGPSCSVVSASYTGYEQ